MEVFIRNLDARADHGLIEEWLTPILEAVGIRFYRLHKKRGKTFATLTLTNAMKGHQFIQSANTTSNLPYHSHTGRTPSFSKSKNEPDQFEVKLLRKQEAEFNARGVTPKLTEKKWRDGPREQSQSLQIQFLECGRWEAEDAQVGFVPFFHMDSRIGFMSKKGRALNLKANDKALNHNYEIVFEYMHIQSLVISRTVQGISMFLTLNVAPKLYTNNEAGPIEDSPILQLMSRLQISSKKQQNLRLSSFLNSSGRVLGTCLVYRFHFGQVYRVEDLQKKAGFLISRHVPVSQKPYSIKPPCESFEEQVQRLERAVIAYRLSFPLRLQLQALWANALLSPSEVLKLLPILKIMQNKASTPSHLISILRFLHSQLQATGPGLQTSDGGLRQAIDIVSQESHTTHLESDEQTDGEIAVHRVMVTPAGTYLYGPDKEVPNRVVRQYRGYENHFLRVSFTEETGDKIQFDSEVSNENILRGKFLSTLRDGLTIAGEKFEFLGFSHSSLRSQSCWFMRAFTHQGNLVTARSAIARLGDFSHIHCPAKCAARIGQAFSNTQGAISIDAREVLTMPDVERGRFTFTDGCGTISQKLCLSLRKGTTSQTMPTLFQIRYRGAKGMISLDSRLLGRQMRLRKSMIKFTGSPSNEIEICGTNARPLLFKLNRPLIKILEDLGVPDESFEILQAAAVQKLNRDARSKSSATDFLRSKLSDNASGMGPLVKSLVELSIDVTEDSFVRSVIRSLIEVELHELKFRTRIPVARAVTLYGISDETGFLQEGQVYITFETETSKRSIVKGRVMVTRSPALHPGDVQIATAVSAPEDSPLLHLTNCIVFSQMGDRDLPSMLGGGDLDGDLFHIVYDKDLIPPKTCSPAAYEPVKALDIGRSVTADDMTEFFINFMESDQLGRIATLHQVYADRDEKGTLSENCLELAALHSKAVDFSKSGQAVNWKDIPQPSPYRPDFMAPSTSTRVERDKAKAEQAAQTEKEDGGSRYTYYESERILGKLYRSINEDEFFHDLEGDTTSLFGREGTDSVMTQIWNFVSESASGCNYNWQTHLTTAQQVRDYYSSMLLDIMSQYAIHGQTQTLTETEVFIGTIIGRFGAGSGKHQREQSELIKARYKQECRDIRQWMRSQTRDDTTEYTALAIACLYLCCGQVQTGQGYFGESVKSFGWFAAAACVPRLVREQESLFELVVGDDGLVRRGRRREGFRSGTGVEA